MEFSMDPADIPETNQTKYTNNEPTIELQPSSEATQTINTALGTEAMSNQVSMDGGANLEVTGTDDKLVQGTPFREETWRRRTRNEIDVSVDQRFLDLGSFTPYPVDPSKPRGSVNSMHGETNQGMGGIYSKFSKRSSAGGQATHAIDRGQVPTGLRENDPLDELGYWRRGRQAFRASCNRHPRDFLPHEWCRSGHYQHNHIKPPTFDGANDFNAYLTQFEITSDLNEWSYETKAVQLAVSLRGGAAEILNDIPIERRRDYDLIVKSLMDRFQPQNQRRLHVAKLRARIRKRNEPLEELAMDIKKMVRLAYPELNMKCREDMTLEYFTEALNDDQQRRDLIVGGPTTMTDALRLATEVELSYSRQSQTFARSVQNSDSLLKRIEKLERLSETHATCTYRIAKIGEYSGLDANSAKVHANLHKRICNYCHAPGHIRKYCPIRIEGQNQHRKNHQNPQIRNSWTQNDEMKYQGPIARKQGNF